MLTVKKTFQGHQNEEKLKYDQIYFLISCTVLPCDRQPCKNGGKCTNDGDTCFKCACPKGFKGKDCSQKGNYDFVQ